MVLHWNCQPRIVHISCKALHDIRDEGLFAIIRQCQELCRDRCCAYEPGNEPRRHALDHRSCVFAYAGLLEYPQHFSSGRTSAFGDFGASGRGALAGTMVILLLRFCCGRRLLR